MLIFPGRIRSNTLTRQLKRLVVPVNDCETQRHVRNMWNQNKRVFFSPIAMSNGVCLHANGAFIFIYEKTTVSFIRKLYKQSDTLHYCSLEVL